MENNPIETIRAGGIVVMPTDTIYGMLASAFNPAAVNKLFAIRKRDQNKPFIVLISDPTDLAKFGVNPTAEQTRVLEKLWPGPVSIILGATAFRLPANPGLRELIAQTGPLVAPSVNPEGQAPATTIAEAKAYFGEAVDLYVDGGTIAGQPSTLIALAPDGGITTLRGILGH